MTLMDMLKKVNSVSFIEVRAKDGGLMLFIPAWAAALALFLFIRELKRARRNKS